MQLATQQLQLQNGVLCVNFLLQLATQRLLRCRLQKKLPRVTWPLEFSKSDEHSVDNEQRILSQLLLQSISSLENYSSSHIYQVLQILPKYYYSFQVIWSKMINQSSSRRNYF